MSVPQIESSSILDCLIFTRYNTGSRFVYTHTDHLYHSMPETVEHKNIRFKTKDLKFNDEPPINGEITVSILYL